MNDEIPKQPGLVPIPKTSIFKRGARRSVIRLEQLEFDPIYQLVSSHREIVNEIAYQKELRSGAKVEVGPGGRVRGFNAENLSKLYDQKLTVEKELLRYGYGRVPETLEVNTKPIAPLVVEMTGKGQVYVANKFEDVDDVLENIPDTWDD